MAVYLMLILALLVGLLVTAPAGLAQSPRSDAILVIWNDELFAQGIAANERITAPQHLTRQPPPTQYGNVFSYGRSPLAEPPLDGYGFVQGVWSSDQRVFAFLAIQPNDAGYQVIALENGQQRRLFAGQITPERGYLVPVGWRQDGGLILLERHRLHNLEGVRLWRYSEIDASLSAGEVIAVPDLKGNSASLENGWVFVGFDTVRMLGYLVNIESGQSISFPTSLALQDPPASVFELYPLDIVGVVDLAAFKAWAEQPPSPSDRASDAHPLSAAFLYWPLPDDARSVTCYPDSEWTDLRFPLECPGLTVPRGYPGHEGTDIGGKPNGLAVGTPVYAAARGLVVQTYTTCPSQDITCGDAYGNTLLLEHALVTGYEVQTWFTGYAHLQTVLVEPYAYVREIGLPIALSGDTGLGGAHLHFEVRSPHLGGRANWIDPWDTRSTQNAAGLWIGGSDTPTAAVVAEPPPTQMICQTVDGNNIRSGPGTDYAVIAQTTAQTEYQVFQVRRIDSGGTPGDWYQVRWAGTDASGWVWSDLMTGCRQKTN